MSSENGASEAFVAMRVSSLVLRQSGEGQSVQLVEAQGSRSFPIVIGAGEALELRRVLLGQETPRPLTHSLLMGCIAALGARLEAVRVTDLAENTFHAQLLLRDQAGVLHAIDGRPSDALALALRVGARIEVAESVLEQARTDLTGPDPLPPSPPPAEEEEGH